jgi:4-hydroxybenzoate-CoA ligase
MGSYNAAVDMVDRNVAEGRGGKIAFSDPARRISYGELAESVARVGPMLARLGLQREDRLAMIMLDTVDFPILFWGAIRAGIIPIPLNTLLPVEQFHYILADSRAKALFVSAPFLKIAESAAGGVSTLQKVIVVGDASAQSPDFAAMLNAEGPAAAADTCADEVAFWLYSSGSTGMPKGVRHVHSSPMATAVNYAQPVLGITGNDVCFSAGKLYPRLWAGQRHELPDVGRRDDGAAA